MSYIDLVVERRIAEAIERGEFDMGTYRGRPLPDLDRMRPPGWWAEQFVRHEKSRLRAEDARDERNAWYPRFWRAPTRTELAQLVAEANRRIVELNAALVDDDALELFDAFGVAGTWRRLRSTR